MDILKQAYDGNSYIIPRKGDTTWRTHASTSIRRSHSDPIIDHQMSSSFAQYQALANNQLTAFKDLVDLVVMLHDLGWSWDPVEEEIRISVRELRRDRVFYLTS